MRVQQLEIDRFDYSLPEDRIARYPLPERDASRLLMYSGGRFSDHTYRELPGLLPPKTQLVFNNTRVVQARLLFRRPTGARIEVFCLEPMELDLQQAMATRGSIHYRCLVGNAKKWKEDRLALEFLHNNTPEQLQAELLGREGELFDLRLSWTGPATFAEVLESAGSMPLPPYMKRESEASDKDRYQTVYARPEGSVAAPTAGLHFTNSLLQNLRLAGVGQWTVTLHVGAGTFKPVDCERIGEHEMHREPFRVSKAFLHFLLRPGQGPVIPVGTTSLRCLESLYWMGVRAHRGLPWQTVEQWDPYELEPVDTATALGALISRVDGDELWGMTRLMIAPGYTFRFAKGLITNFHQPKSTLLLLIAALIGDRWREGYQHALDTGYRFLSYGDGMLLLPE